MTDILFLPVSNTLITVGDKNGPGYSGSEVRVHVGDYQREHIGRQVGAFIWNDGWLHYRAGQDTPDRLLSFQPFPADSAGGLVRNSPRGRQGFIEHRLPQGYVIGIREPATIFCPTCGHTQGFHANLPRIECTSCGNFIFRDWDTYLRMLRQNRETREILMASRITPGLT